MEKLGYTKIPDQVLKQIAPNSKIGTWIENYCPHASVTRQLFDHKITPMNYWIDENYNLSKVVSVIEYNIAEFNYILHYGLKDDYFDDKKFFKTLGKRRRSRNELVTLQSATHLKKYV